MSKPKVPDIHYRLQPPYGMRLSVRGCSDADIRAVIGALWAVLPEEHRADTIKELQHYQAGLPDTFLDPLAAALCRGQHGQVAPQCGTDHPEQERITVQDRLDGITLQVRR